MKKRFDGVSARFLDELETRGISGYRMMKDKVMKSQASLTAIKNGTQGVPRSMIDACSDLYGLDKRYVLLGSTGGDVSNRGGDQMIMNASNSTVTESNNKTAVTGRRSLPATVMARSEKETVRVPLVRQEEARSVFGPERAGIYTETDAYVVEPDPGEHVTADAYVVFQVNGDGMSPVICDGSKVLARKIREDEWAEMGGVVFVLYGNRLTVRRVLKNSLCANGAVTLKADNPVYGQIDVGRNEIRGVWKAERIVSQKIK